MSDRLIDRWVSGTASAEDRAELVELIEKDPALIDRLFRAAERECDLHEFFGGLPVTRVWEGGRGGRHPVRRLQQGEREYDRRRRPILRSPLGPANE